MTVFTLLRPKELHAQNATESLIELREMLHFQVQSSKEAMHSLISSSSRISETGTGMEEIGASAKASSGLISKYNRREWTDRFLISAGLLLFFGVVLYIIQKRLLGWLW